MHKYIYRTALTVAITSTVFFHLWKLGTIPQGLYIDEASIGYNAYLIATTGHDEHRQILPVYFRAFGEYKNPLYIYATALLFKLLSISEFTLRLTSFFFQIILTGATYILAGLLFPQKKAITIYALLCSSFVPWLFAPSRIAFEAISQPAIVALALVFIYKTNHTSQHKKKWWINPILAGAFMGLSIYTYSTARLLTPILFITWALIYTRKKTLHEALITTGSFCGALLPYAYFMIANPGALTERFRIVSYIYNPSLTLSQKVGTLTANYTSIFTTDFLVWHGDNILRHATGNTGELFFIVFLLTGAGLIGLLSKTSKNPQFAAFILINAAVTPIASALTIHGSGTPSALRTIMMSVYVILISCYGFNLILEKTKPRQQRIILALVIALLCIEITTYLYDYMTHYPERSIGWFESFDFKGALTRAIKENPKEIHVSTQGNQSGILLAFYNLTIANPHNIPIKHTQPQAQQNTCLIFFSQWEAPPQNPQKLPYHETSPQNSLTKAYCYTTP